jgi:hypothetical protein
MNRTETAALLTLMAAYDRRTLGPEDVLAWQSVLADVSLDDAKGAVVEHHRGSSDWLAPADVIAGVRRIRAQRLEHADRLLPAADPDDVAGYLAALRQGRRELASGQREAPPLLPALALPAGKPGLASIAKGVSEYQREARRVAALAAERAAGRAVAVTTNQQPKGNQL